MLYHPFAYAVVSILYQSRQLFGGHKRFFVIKFCKNYPAARAKFTEINAALKMIFAESDEGVSVGEVKSILQYTQEMIEGYRLELPSPYGV